MPDATEILSPAAAREWPAPYDYAAFAARVAMARRRALAGQRFGIATLAAVAIAVTALLLVSARQRPALATEEAAIVSAGADPGDAASSTVMDESWLRHLPQESAIARVSTRAPVALLEDRIAWLDDSLSVALQEQAAHGEVLRLRSQRAQLVDALVRVRYAEQLSVDAN